MKKIYIITTMMLLLLIGIVNAGNCDVNNDKTVRYSGETKYSDIKQFNNLLNAGTPITGEQKTRLDVDKNGIINTTDYNICKNIWHIDNDASTKRIYKTEDKRFQNLLQKSIEEITGITHKSNGHKANIFYGTGPICIKYDEKWTCKYMGKEVTEQFANEFQYKKRKWTK